MIALEDRHLTAAYHGTTMVTNGGVKVVTAYKDLVMAHKVCSSLSCMRLL